MVLRQSLGRDDLTVLNGIVLTPRPSVVDSDQDFLQMHHGVNPQERT